MPNNKRTQRLLSMFIITFLIIFLALPMVSLFMKAFQDFNGQFIGLDNFKEYLTSRGFKISLKNSIIVGSLSTIGAMILAFLYAYGIERANIKFKSFYNWIALLPLFAPTMTHGIALIYLFGKKGIITNGLGLDFNIYGLWGIVISEILYLFPIIYTVISLGLKKNDNRLYEVAESMGTTSFRKFITITLPSLKFSLLTGFFTAFTMAFTDFGAPKTIGGNFNVLATEVYKKILGQQEIEMGAVVGLVLTIPAIIALIVNIIANKRNKYTLDSKATSYIIKESKTRDCIYYIINSVIATLIIIIFITILISAITTNWPYDMSLTIKWFNFKVLGMSGWHIFGNSIMVSLISAFLGTALCFLAAYIYERSPEMKFLNQVIYFLSTLPNVIPGLTLGIAYMLFFNQGNNPLKFIYGTFIILIVVNVMHFFATPFLTISSGLKGIDKEFENVSEVMGVNIIRLIKDVIIPNTWSAIVESFSYYFINSMMTVSAVVFLYAPYTRLASISMINKSETGDIAAASAIAVMIILTNMAFRAICNRYLRKLKQI